MNSQPCPIDVDTPHTVFTQSKDEANSRPDNLKRKIAYETAEEMQDDRCLDDTLISSQAVPMEQLEVM